ncbi:hypothetical protein FA95DRAFT_1577217 [Auriscalpium vulgare]|uniref:Uncharacterized protein n=1 Tax=Auriscalpium vulgare TaxID=40419 RepID=A0ACB8R8U4_9AGAM|nr:hypothetical protein FA95DRAFT_1577217 [Auriscalpium vulgare]
MAMGKVEKGTKTVQEDQVPVNNTRGAKAKRSTGRLSCKVPHCVKTFGLSGDYTKHLKCVHKMEVVDEKLRPIENPEEFICEMCQTHLSRRDALKRHRRRCAEAAKKNEEQTNQYSSASLNNGSDLCEFLREGEATGAGVRATDNGIYMALASVDEPRADAGTTLVSSPPRTLEAARTRQQPVSGAEAMCSLFQLMSEKGKSWPVRLARVSIRAMFAWCWPFERNRAVCKSREVCTCIVTLAFFGFGILVHDAIWSGAKAMTTLLANHSWGETSVPKRRLIFFTDDNQTEKTVDSKTSVKLAKVDKKDDTVPEDLCNINIGPQE